MAPKVFENAELAFLKNFRAPYRQRYTDNVNNIEIFLAQFFYGLSDGGTHFSIQRISF